MPSGDSICFCLTPSGYKFAIGNHPATILNALRARPRHIEETQNSINEGRVETRLKKHKTQLMKERLKKNFGIWNLELWNSGTLELISSSLSDGKKVYCSADNPGRGGCKFQW